jgi:hypothetical protein
MGFLDNLKDKTEELGEKAGFGAARDAEISAVETPADEVGDVGHAPAADPLDPALEAVDPMIEPAEPVHLTDDPLDPGLEAVAPMIEPAGPTTLDEDPLEAPPDRTG